jgi:hypothetical protein
LARVSVDEPDAENSRGGGGAEPEGQDRQQECQQERVESGAHLAWIGDGWVVFQMKEGLIS